MSCADVETIQPGNGSQTLFSFDFPYLFKSDIQVSFWNATTKEWDVKAQNDATYPWQVTDANPTIVEFTGTAPPAPAVPVDPNETTVDNVKISRVTNIDNIRALFNPGSAIRSDDLNKNFEQLRYAIQEANCQGISDELYQYLLDNYWDRFDNTIYSGDAWVSNDTKLATTGAIDNRVDSKIDTALTTDIVAGASITITDNSPANGQITIGVDADFGSQNVVTTGTSTAANFTPTSSTIPTNGVYLPSTNTVGIATNSTGKVFVDANGKVGLGTATPGSYHPYVDNFVIEGSVNEGISIISGNSHAGSIWFGDSDGQGQGQIIYLHLIDEMRFSTNASVKMSIDSQGRVLIGTTSNAGGSLLQVNGDRIRVSTPKTPASATDTGTAGEICWDANYIYVCTATNTWKRTALSTW